MIARKYEYINHHRLANFSEVSDNFDQILNLIGYYQTSATKELEEKLNEAQIGQI